jgi:hypothetical protein
MNDTELILFETKFELNGQYQDMLDIIKQEIPEVQRATALFNKTQSQFMDNMLTIHNLTPLRNMRQILAEMKKIRLALGGSFFAIDKKRKLPQTDETDWEISCIQENVLGAIRKLANYSVQYAEIQRFHNLYDFTEKDFEEEEEKYHIIKAFEQGLSAARSHGGSIDEGNQIYFHQIGINGTAAQREVLDYFKSEAEVLATGNMPTHRMQIDWLLSMAEKYKGCSIEFARFKGLISQAEEVLLQPLPSATKF